MELISTFNDTRKNILDIGIFLKFDMILSFYAN